MVNNLRVVIAAAGKSKRMGGNDNKQYMKINSYPVLAYSLNFFEKTTIVDEIVIVTAKNEIEYCQKELVDKYKIQKVAAVIAGGKERQDSVWKGLQYLNKNTDYVAVHDGARPLISETVLHNLLKEAEKWGAAVPGVRSKDTIKMIDRDGFVKQTLDRDRLIAIQTPQVFKFSELQQAYLQAIEDDFMGTDDATLFERYIGRVKVVEGDYNNIKITTPGDLNIVKSLMGKLKIESDMQ